MLQIHLLRPGEKADSRERNCFLDFSISNICVQNRRFSTLSDDVTYLIIDKLTTNYHFTVNNQFIRWKLSQT